MTGPAEKKKGLGSGPKFFLAMLAIYGVTGAIKPELAGRALVEFGQMAGKIIPILGLVFVMLFLINLLLDPAWIRRHLGRDSGWQGWLYAVVGGIFVSGPPYMLYPMLSEFRRHGARQAFLAVILYNRNVKIPFIPVLIYYFGLRYTVILSLYIILFSLANGWLVERLVGSPRTK
ncbi:MAG: hypothetical protein L3J03_02595 [Desulfobacterales bacterium]|nr:hypothetical protein [Desulfobacterales bacterium]